MVASDQEHAGGFVKRVNSRDDLKPKLGNFIPISPLISRDGLDFARRPKPHLKVLGFEEGKQRFSDQDDAEPANKGSKESPKDSRKEIFQIKDMVGSN